MLQLEAMWTIDVEYVGRAGGVDDVWQHRLWIRCINKKIVDYTTHAHMACVSIFEKKGGRYIISLIMDGKAR